MLNGFNENRLRFKMKEYRIYFIFIILFVLASITAPRFCNIFNLTNILRTATLNGFACIGFTIALLCGHLDLSVLSVINLSANIVISLSLVTSWTIAIITALFSGILVGFINGLLVTKAKIHSLIVTLGTMITVQGIVYLWHNGTTISTGDFRVADWLDSPIIPLMPSRVIITIVFVILFEILLARTVYGRGFFIVGGNKETAWLAGINVDRYLITAFTLSGFTSALGGTIFSICLASAPANIGERGINPFMIVLAAVVLGGTSMNGGYGSVLKSFFGVLTMTMIFNALTCFGAKYETQIFICGLVLGIVILHEAYLSYRDMLYKGQKTELLKELQLLSKYKEGQNT